MNESFQQGQWEYPGNTNAPNQANRLVKRAAICTWIVGGIEFLFGSCMTCGFASLATQSTEQIIDSTKGMYTLDQINQLKEMAPAFTLGGVIFAVVPSILLLILAFFVWRSSKPAIWFAAIVTLAQSIILALLVLLTVAGALMIGDLATLTVAILFLGTPLALLIYTTYLLGKSAMQQSSPSSDIEDYWD